MIYLDNASTTKPCLASQKALQKSCDSFFNPSSIYLDAILVAKDINEARITILKKLGGFGGNLIFTSGATEANNLALYQATKTKNKTLITTMGEHPSVFNYAKHLASQGMKVEFVSLNENGEVDFEELKKLINKEVGFVSIMYVNNETGAINPIKEISAFIKNISKEIIFHVDAVQAFSKIDINVKDLGIDLLTISSHKIHGVKGTGALYYANNINIKPLMLGGGQEFNHRSGTENVAGIMAFKAAVEEDNIIDPNLRKRAITLLKKLENIKINANGINNILSVSASGVKAEVIARKLADNNILVSIGSACNSNKADNRVLSSMGVSKQFIDGTVRFSFSKYNTLEEVETAFKKYIQIVKDLRNV